MSASHKKRSVAQQRAAAAKAAAKHAQDVIGCEKRRCVLCAEELHSYVVRPCGHNDVCATCAARMRVLLGDYRCAMCKHEAEFVVVTRKEDREFESFPTFGQHASKDLLLDQRSGMFFDDAEDYEYIVGLRQFQVGVGNDLKKFETLNELQKYLREKHKRMLCEICYHNKHKFVMELPRFTGEQWRQHCRKGDKKSGFRGHPPCRFCQKRFYDDGELFVHMRDNHFHCDVCVQHGMQDLFFASHAEVLKHYREAHFVCEESECLQFPYRAFGSELELKAHMSAIHNKRLSRADRRLGLRFQYQESSEASANNSGQQRLTARSRNDSDDLGYEGLLYDDTGMIAGRAPEEQPVVVDSSAFPSLPSSNTSVDDTSKSRLSTARRAKPSYATAAPPIGREHFPGLRSGSSSNGVTHRTNGNWSSSATASANSTTNDDLGGMIKIRKKKSKPKAVSKEPSSSTMEASSSVSGASKSGMTILREICNQDKPARFDEFKRLSSEFRKHALSTKQYFGLVTALFQPSELNQFFGMLILRLPDPAQKTELQHLFHIYQDNHRLPANVNNQEIYSAQDTTSATSIGATSKEHPAEGIRKQKTPREIAESIAARARAEGKPLINQSNAITNADNSISAALSDHVSTDLQLSRKSKPVQKMNSLPHNEQDFPNLASSRPGKSSAECSHEVQSRPWAQAASVQHPARVTAADNKRTNANQSAFPTLAEQKGQNTGVSTPHSVRDTHRMLSSKVRERERVAAAEKFLAESASSQLLNKSSSRVQKDEHDEDAMLLRGTNTPKPRRQKGKKSGRTKVSLYDL